MLPISTIRTPCSHPVIVKNVLDVDNELKPEYVSRSISVDQATLVTYVSNPLKSYQNSLKSRTFSAVSLRTLRTSTNAFLDNLKLVISSINTFDKQNYRSTDVLDIKEGSKERDRHGQLQNQ